MAISNSNRTYDTIQGDLADQFGKSSDTGAKAKAATSWKKAIRTVGVNVWRQLRRRTDIALAATVNSYTLPDGWEFSFIGKLLDSSDNEIVTVESIDADVFLREQPKNDSTGHPRLMTALIPYQDGLLYVFPTPTAANTTVYPKLRLYYRQTLLVPSSTASVMDGPSWLEETVFDVAAAHMAILMEQGELIPFFTQQAQLSLDKARAHDRDPSATYQTTKK